MAAFANRVEYGLTAEYQGDERESSEGLEIQSQPDFSVGEDSDAIKEVAASEHDARGGDPPICHWLG